MVEATLALSTVINSTPKKLNTAAIRIAAFGPMALVETQVAMAFGASVQPLTRITPVVNNTVIASAGLEMNCARKLVNVIVIQILPSFIFEAIFAYYFYYKP